MLCSWWKRRSTNPGSAKTDWHALKHELHEEHCTALCCARNGQSAQVLRLEGDPHEAARLRDLGLREGATVTVLRDGDPLMVRVDDARFGIGRAAAECVICGLESKDEACLLLNQGTVMNDFSMDNSAVSDSDVEKLTLDCLKPGAQAVVCGLECEPEVTERLMELGLIIGTPLRVVKFAPLGDPMEIVMRGYHLSLRRIDAAGVIVKAA